MDVSDILGIRPGSTPTFFFHVEGARVTALPSRLASIRAPPPDAKNADFAPASTVSTCVPVPLSHFVKLRCQNYSRLCRGGRAFLSGLRTFPVNPMGGTRFDGFDGWKCC